MPNRKEQPPANAPDVRYLRPPALPAVMLVTSKFGGASMAPSTVDRRWIFAHTDVGDGDIMVARAEVRMQPGVLLAVEPGDCITPLRRRSDSTAFRTVMVEPEYVAKFVETAFPERAVELRRGLLGDAATQAFEALWSAVGAGDAPFEQENLLAAFLEAASDETRPLPASPITAPIARAKKLLEERFADDVRLEELEAEIGLSRFYLVRRFRAEVGMPPHAYQLAMRLDKARVLVASGMPLADVASRCGFTDQSHLTRHFRRATGVAPGAYARATGVRR